MKSSLLVLGAGGYIGRHLVPALGRQGDFTVTAVSSQPRVLEAFADLRPVIQPLCCRLEALPLEIARNHDLILNLATAGVAHKDGDDIDILSQNIAIAHRICQLAESSRRRLLVHFGSDTEQASLSVYLNSSQGMSLPAAMCQPDASIYAIAKIVQSSLIRHHVAKEGFFAHVIMTPNVYGGDDPPDSLMGQMRSSIEAGLPFTLQRPEICKRFVRMDAFMSYVIALLQDLLTRISPSQQEPFFEVSNVDFVPRVSVASFAQQQWLLLGGERSAIQCTGLELVHRDGA